VKSARPDPPAQFYAADWLLPRSARRIKRPIACLLMSLCWTGKGRQEGLCGEKYAHQV